MKIGYPCQNWSENLSTNHTFRLNSFSKNKFIDTVQKNIGDFFKIIDYNAKNEFLFFRIGSSFIPFASHPVCDVEWKVIFKKDLLKLGKKIQENKMRISMHPGQYTILNSKNPNVVNRSLSELGYHCDLLDLMGLDKTAKIQIHVGFPYEDKDLSISKFIEVYEELPQKIKNRLVIENDEKFFRVSDCLKIYDKTKIPILFDTFHFKLLPDHDSVKSFDLVKQTWEKSDGLPMIDYSMQQKGAKKGRHCDSIDIVDFAETIHDFGDLDFDIMLELKDKEKSAVEVSKYLEKL